MIGQSQVAEPLMTALRTGRVGHAYLFSGPRGCGKTTSARILARCLNCAEGPTDTPCGTCPSCVELSRDGGGSLDVVEIDAASHGGVDDARDLRERAVFAPARDRFKIFIIDEAHMVTPGGFNALLKIVEEPPPHVKFIFATTEPEKVIGTIRSRTHHYPFRLVAPAPLIDYVQSLCDSENVRVEAGVLPLVVRAGGGSVRDTLSILDQLIAGSEAGQVTLDRASGLLGFTHTELLDEVVAAFGAHDASAAFTATDRVVQTGQDPRRFVEDLLQRLRDLIVVGVMSVQGATAVFRGVPEDQLQRMYEQSQQFQRGELSRIADTVSKTLERMTGVTAPKLQLELMIARALLQQSSLSSSTTEAVAQAPTQQAPTQQEPVQQDAMQKSSAPQAPVQQQEQVQDSSQPQQPTNTSNQDAPEQPQVERMPVSPPSVEGAAASSTVAPAAETAAGNPAMSAAEAARAAREFLRTDTAGAAAFGRPVTDVLGMMSESQASSASPAQSDSNVPSAPNVPSDPTASSASPVPTESAVPTEPPVVNESPVGNDHATASDSHTASDDRPQEPAQSAPETAESHSPLGDQRDAIQADVSFAEIEQVWPDLLDELLESDRDAWNIVRTVTPLDLSGDLLALGFASRSDLEVFRTTGAAPLREALAGALGITVRYQPRQAPPQVDGADDTESQNHAEVAAPNDASASEPRATEPHAESQIESQQSGAAALGPVGAAPAWQDYDPHGESESAEPTPPAAPTAVEPAPPSEPALRSEPEPRVAPPQAMESPQGAAPSHRTETSQGAVLSQRAEASQRVETPQSTASTAPVEASQPTQPAHQAPAQQQEKPEFTRYGEAVVREVLGARFVEERPLPSEGER